MCNNNGFVEEGQDVIVVLNYNAWDIVTVYWYCILTVFIYIIYVDCRIIYNYLSVISYLNHFF